MTTRRPKRSRTRRGKARLIEITDRDLDSLILAGLTRYLSLDQLARDRFPSEDRCRRRVRALFDATYLTITLVSSTRPNLISLTRKGLNFIVARRPELETDLHLAGPLRLAGIDHHLAIVDARLYAMALGQQRQAPLIRWSNAGGDLHRELGLLDLHLVSDGLAEFSTSRGRVVVAVEADCSTETLTVLRKKIERYAVVAKQQRLDALWFVLVGGIERQRNIERLIAEAGLSDWARVLPHQHVTARPVRELPARVAAGASASTTLIRPAFELPISVGNEAI